MSLFFHIFLTSIVPIFIIVGAGVFLDRKFNLDLRTLSKFNFYILLPAFIFKSFYSANLTAESLEIALCALVIMLSSSFIAGWYSRSQGYDVQVTEIIRNGTMFNNGGNLGVAVATFVFSNEPYIVNGATPYLEAAVLGVLATFIIQTISCNTLGFYQAGIGMMTKKESLRMVFHMPVVYVVPLSILLRLFPFDLTQTVLWSPLSIISVCFLGIATLTLGVQLNRTSWNIFHKPVLEATVLRLIMGPLAAAIVTALFIRFYGPINAIAAQSIIITYSVPSAVNTALMAVEMKNHPELASQIVLSTTIFSAITMPLAVLLAYYIFPIPQ